MKKDNKNVIIRSETPVFKRPPSQNNSFKKNILPDDNIDKSKNILDLSNNKRIFDLIKLQTSLSSISDSNKSYNSNSS